MSNDNILEKQIIELLTTKTSLKEDVILAKVQMLITLGADINTKHKGKSILCHAKESNLNKVSKYLIENGGIEEKISPEEEQKLTNELANLIYKTPSSITDIQNKINQGANLNILATYDRTSRDYPLFIAIQKGNKELVELLIENGADITPQTPPLKWSVMHQACYWGKKELVDFFIEKKININQEDNSGQTPIILASRVNNTSIVKTLIKNGANIIDRTSTGYSLLEEMCGNSHPNISIASFIIDSGFDINTPEKNKNTTFLMHACSNHNTELAKLLIERGANINAQNDNGNTALIFAASNGYEDIVDILLQNNANPLIKNKSGLTAIDIAEKKSHFIIKYKILDAIKEKKEKTSIFTRIKQGLFFDK